MTDTSAVQTVPSPEDIEKMRRIVWEYDRQQNYFPQAKDPHADCFGGVKR